MVYGGVLCGRVVYCVVGRVLCVIVVHCVLGWCSACWGDILYDGMVYCVVSGVLCGRRTNQPTELYEVRVEPLLG